jgi:penicillin-binding protein 2
MFSFRRIKNIFAGKSKKSGREIDPDEIFLDSKNLPDFDRNQFEGRFEKPISKKSIIACGIVFGLIAVLLLSKVWVLQVENGSVYADKSENNRLRHTVLFAERGVIYDRNKIILASNQILPDEYEFTGRKYADIAGASNLIGYIKYPSKDKSGFYYKEDFEGMDGIEKSENAVLSGENGLRIVETDARGNVISMSVIKPPLTGQSVTLSIDSRIQEKVYEFIKNLAGEVGFNGGAGVIMDVRNGEILASASFPEYKSQILTDGADSKAIKNFVESKTMPFLSRVFDGLYTPGSIVKPFLAFGALNEGIIDPLKKILSTGSISIPNPYYPDLKSVFTDWKAHGLVDMRTALAVSSNVYFYEIGGGFEGQKGLGIANIEKYARLFGFGEDPMAESSGISGTSSPKGTIPNPEWKAENFDGEKWLIGDTYHTAIGQYGFQVTPLQMARAVSAIANGGKLFWPTLIKGGNNSLGSSYEQITNRDDFLQIVREGMRQGVLMGTGKNLDIPQVKVAVKTGTAELGVSKANVNSWIIGFFPYDNPKYAFAFTMEKGKRENTIGALYVVRELLEWMAVETPEYLK